MATVLIPVMAALFYKGKKTAMGGTLSAASGLISCILFYVVIAQIGEYNEVFGTYVWSSSIDDEPYSIWREYALYFCLPISYLGFVVGNRIGAAYRKSSA